MKKTYLVLGLGIFGSSAAKELTKYGQDVIAIDKDMACVERLDEFVTQAVCLDFTDIDELRAVGVADANAAIIATGSRLEESILAIMNLKQLGVPFILAKAKNKRYGEIMSKCGADKIVLPEKEAGIRMAKTLLAWNVIDLMDIDSDYSIMEIKVPASWVGKSLIDLDIRNRYGMNALGIKSGVEHKLSINPDPSYAFGADDAVLVVAQKDIFKHYDELLKERG